MDLQPRRPLVRLRRRDWLAFRLGLDQADYDLNVVEGHAELLECIGPRGNRAAHHAILRADVAGLQGREGLARYRGMGVEGVRVSTLADFADAFASAMRARGPRLIEVMV